MIALSGIFCGCFIGLIVVCQYFRHHMPTDQEVNELHNKLNRIALDRANRKDLK